MPRISPYTIELSAEERAELEARTRSYTSPYKDVVRAKIILMAAEGMENKEIGQRIDLPRQIVSKWRKRFYEEGLPGLEERPRGGKPAAFSPTGGSRGQGAGL
jgi:transposase-like protein